jgi:hypothetical protein
MGNCAFTGTRVQMRRHFLDAHFLDRKYGADRRAARPAAAASVTVAGVFRTTIDLAKGRDIY